MRAGQPDHGATPMSSARISKIDGSRTPVAHQRLGKAEVVETPTARRPVTSHHGLPRVLVVDDQKDVRDTTAAILQSEGYIVLRAANGIEALEKLRKREIDVMLLDLGLPGMDGPALLEELDEPPAVVVCSAFGKWDETEIRRRFTATIVECLRKPVTPTRLIAATAAAAKNRARAS
jgi:CheY-like chemotaxis protein